MSTPEVLSLSDNNEDESQDDSSDFTTTTDTCTKLKAEEDAKNDAALTVNENKMDAFYTKYYKFTNSSLFTERGIKLIQWTMWLLSQLTKNNQRFSKHLSPSLRKFYGDLSLMRYVLRLYGMPLAYDGIRKLGSWAGSPPYALSWKDERITKLGNVMAWSMFIYYPLEHLAYGNWIMPKVVKVDGNKLSAWSCRCWLVYIVADWLSAFLKNCELGEKKAMLLEMAQSPMPSDQQTQQEEVIITTEEIDKCMQMNRLQMVRNFFFTPPCLNWAWDNWDTDPILSENIVNGMSLAEALVCFYQTLKSL